MQRAFLLSLIIHLMIFITLFSQRKEEREIEKVVRQKVRIKFNSKKERAQSSSKSKISQLSFSKLKPIFSKKSFQEINPGDLESHPSLKELIFQRIEEHLFYPSELVSIRRRGVVKVQLLIDSNGYYIEKGSTFNDNSRYLKVHVARVLRKALKNPLEASVPRRFVIPLIFEFKLSNYRLSKFSAITNQALYFYRQASGHEDSGDKYYHYFVKTLMTITNPLMLEEHFPDKKRALLFKAKLEAYKADPSW